MKRAHIADLEQKIGYTFKKYQWLEQALTHSSHAREQESLHGRQIPANGLPEKPACERSVDNEQLEFLGDAVLGFVTSEHLFQRFPEYTEGGLSKLRAQLVSARHLVHIAKDLQLGAYLRLGRGEEKSGGRSKAALLVDALEAVVAALFLDGGLEVARHFVLTWVVNPELERQQAGGTPLAALDYKSELQERLHALGCPGPEYLVISEEGPDHRKLFTLETRIFGPTGEAGFSVRGQGTTKKRAGQDAACEALKKLVTMSGIQAVKPHIQNESGAERTSEPNALRESEGK